MSKIIRTNYGPIKLSLTYLRKPAIKAIEQQDGEFTNASLREDMGLPVKINGQYISPLLGQLLNNFVAKGLIKVVRVLTTRREKVYIKSELAPKKTMREWIIDFLEVNPGSTSKAVDIGLNHLNYAKNSVTAELSDMFEADLVVRTKVNGRYKYSIPTPANGQQSINDAVIKGLEEQNHKLNKELDEAKKIIEYNEGMNKKVELMSKEEEGKLLNRIEHLKRKHEEALKKAKAYKITLGVLEDTLDVEKKRCVHLEDEKRILTDTIRTLNKTIEQLTPNTIDQSNQKNSVFKKFLGVVGR